MLFRSRALSTWRGFCHWLTRSGYLKVDPTDDDLLTAPAVVERLPRAFTADEIDALRTAAADPPVSATGAWPTRDVMIVELLAGSGCRVSELCALQIGDIDRRHEHLILRLRQTKSGSERDVPFPTRILAVTSTSISPNASRPARANPSWSGSVGSRSRIVPRRRRHSGSVPVEAGPPSRPGGTLDFLAV